VSVVVSLDVTEARAQPMLHRDPLRLSRFLLEESIQKGVRLHQPAKAVSLSTDNKGQLAAIRINNEDGSAIERRASPVAVCAQS